METTNTTPVIEVWEGPNGSTLFEPSRRGYIYGNRGRIKEVGGKWNPDAKRWEITPEQGRQLADQFPKVFVVCVPCTIDCGIGHIDTDYVPIDMAVIGQSVSHFCPHCDGRGGGRVVEVQP